MPCQLTGTRPLTVRVFETDVLGRYTTERTPERDSNPCYRFEVKEPLPSHRPGC